MKRVPQIFTRINAQNVPVSDAVLDVIEQEEIIESVLREYVRELLTEAAKAPEDLTGDMYVQIDGADYGWQVKLMDPDERDYAVGLLYLNSAADAEGACSGAFIVRQAKARHGWGPLLYDVAIELASMHGAGLTPDREEVSDEALGVWHYYLHNRPDVEKLQLDDFEDPFVTPDDDSDDCRHWQSQLNHVSWAGNRRRDPASPSPGGWMPSDTATAALPDDGRLAGWKIHPLTKVYRVNGTPTIDKLRKLKRLVE